SAVEAEALRRACARDGDRPDAAGAIVDRPQALAIGHRQEGRLSAPFSFLRVEVTGDPAAVDLGERRRFHSAARHGMRAARVKLATGWRLERARYFAGQHDFLAALVGMGR